MDPSHSVSENVGDVLLTVRRQHGSHGTVRLKYDSVDGSAVGGKDFVPLDGKVAPSPLPPVPLQTQGSPHFPHEQACWSLLPGSCARR